jgi:hypothetical protein
MDIHCGWPPGYIPTPDFLALVAGIEYLRGISGNCRAPPRSCSRVSCSWGSAIYYCNDNAGEFWVPCRSLGDIAASIVTECADQFNNGRTHGQAFNVQNWNVIVAAGEC